MKIIRLCFFIFPFLISCSSAESDAALDSQSQSLQRLVDLGYDMAARNSANPYDDVGQVHNELMLTYYYAESQPLTFSGRVSVLTMIANSNSSFYHLNKNATYVLSTTHENRLLDIISEQDSCLTPIIDSSVVGQAARDSLEDFVHDFLDLCETEDEYEVIYDFVVDYEDTVLKHTLWTADDKRVVLITTSVARHSAYARKKKPKKNKDPDWEYMVGNIIATISGAGEGEAEAVMMGLVAGVVEN